ncbi:MAG: DNA repair exonuclease [archaeon]
MRFAHFADIHIGSWRDERLAKVSLEAFRIAVQTSIERKADFVLVPGDVFNTSLPPMDQLKEVVRGLKRLSEADIPVYFIPGSHDFSPSGKTMLDVLEEAGLWIKVSRGNEVDGKLVLEYTTDERTGAKITGILGKRGALDRTYYDLLDREALGKEKGFRIFLFHTAISEMKPAELKEMEAPPVSILPEGFDYYAGGHVHVVDNQSFSGRKNVVFPGPVFPNNFAEIEKLQQGSMVIYEDGKIEHVAIKVKPIRSLTIDCAGKTPGEVQAGLEALATPDIKDHIVTLRLKGELSEGRTVDIDFSAVFDLFMDAGAYVVMKNTAQLSGKEFERITVKEGSVESVESRIIDEHLGQKDIGKAKEDERSYIVDLMRQLDTQKQEGETQATYEERISGLLESLLEN